MLKKNRTKGILDNTNMFSNFMFLQRNFYDDGSVEKISI